MNGTLLYLNTPVDLTLPVAICMCGPVSGWPTEKHLNCVKRSSISKKNCTSGSLGIPKASSFATNTFADADHAGCQDTRRSTSVMEYPRKTDHVLNLYGVIRWLVIGISNSHDPARTEASTQADIPLVSVEVLSDDTKGVKMNIRVNSFTMKMEILLEPTSNKLMVGYFKEGGEVPEPADTQYPYLHASLTHKTKQIDIMKLEVHVQDFRELLITVRPYLEV
ncbi:hypothetical protein Tco_1394681 [Tanacetum coccineum]